MIGASVGFILGYIVARLRTIEKKVDAVQFEVHETDVLVKRSRDEEGAMKRPRLSQVGLALVVLLVVWASFMTGKTNADLDHSMTCVTVHNVKLGRSLTSRDSATRAGTNSEIDLWTLYERLYKIATSDPKKIPVVQDRLNKAIIQHRDNLRRLQKIRTRHPYPKPNVLINCKETNDE